MRQLLFEKNRLSFPNLPKLNFKDVWNMYRKLSISTKLSSIVQDIVIDKITIVDDDVTIENVVCILVSPFYKTYIRLEGYNDYIIGDTRERDTKTESQLFIYLSLKDLINYKRFIKIVKLKLSKSGHSTNKQACYYWNDSDIEYPTGPTRKQLKERKKADAERAEDSPYYVELPVVDFKGIWESYKKASLLQMIRAMNEEVFIRKVDVKYENKVFESTKLYLIASFKDSEICKSGIQFIGGFNNSRYGIRYEPQTHMKISLKDLITYKRFKKVIWPKLEVFEPETVEGLIASLNKDNN